MTPAALKRTLTAREVEVLRLVAAGFSNERIAVELRITADAARSHVRATIRKLGADNRAHAVWLGCGLGLLVPPGSGAVSAAPLRPEVPAAMVAELIALAEQVWAGKPSASLRGQAGRALVAAGRRTSGGRPLASARSRRVSS